MKTINIQIENRDCGQSFKFTKKAEFDENEFIDIILKYIYKVGQFIDSEVASFEYSKNLNALYFDDEIDIIYEENINALVNECKKLFDNNEHIFCFAVCYEEHIRFWFSFIVDDIKEEA